MKDVIKIIRKILGVILMVIGAIGFLIPLPFVPFFLLFFLGMAIYGVEAKKTFRKIFKKQKAR
jgi:uncharacterized protein YqgC (DUF456 family)